METTEELEMLRHIIKRLDADLKDALTREQAKDEAMRCARELVVAMNKHANWKLDDDNTARVYFSAKICPELAALDAALLKLEEK